ncbi:T9SS type A sorting domain-containing protein [bacterium]|nr:T9SS type A sorting domain-containing protein [bacterium]
MNARYNIVQGNIIGADIQGESALGGQEEGVWIGDGASTNLVGGETSGEGKIISGNEGYGITLAYSGTDSNRIIGNRIGTDASGWGGVPNRQGGVNLSNGTTNNQIGLANTIRFNQYGILVYHDSTLFNRITQNSISDNIIIGINLVLGGNRGISAPVFSLDADGIHGTTIPKGKIEIFSDSSSQGLVYEGSVNADEGGGFSWIGTPAGPFITATVTDPEGNTSAFSSPTLVTSLETEDPKLISGGYILFNNFPNPFNPSTVIRYTLPHGTDVELMVYDTRGRRIEVLAKGYQEGGIHEVRFDGGALAGGLYFYRLKAGDFEEIRKMVLIR